VLRVRSPKENLVDDHVRSGVDHGCHPTNPGVLESSKLRPDADLTVGRERDHATGQGRDEGVGAECQPRLGENRLQTADDAGLPRAGTTVEHDHLCGHGAIMAVSPPTVVADS